VAKKTKKQEDALKKVSVQRLNIRDFEYSADSKAPVDVYIRLPKNKRFVLWIEQGEEFSKDKIDKIAAHPDPYVYVVEGPLFWGERPGRIMFQEIPQVNQTEFNKVMEISESEIEERPVERSKGKGAAEVRTFESSSTAKSSDRGSPQNHQAESLVAAAAQSEESTPKEAARREVRGGVQLDSKAVESRLWGLYQPILRREAGANLSTLSEIGYAVTELVSEDLWKFKNTISQNPKYKNQISDSAAIYGIGTLFFISNCYTLRGILEELGFAILFMDLPVMELGEETLMRYYQNPESLGPQEKVAFMEHPTTAFKMAREKMKKVSQNCLRMIEGHHEWATGEGFPRGIRNENLPPLVRILSFSVLVFEALKRGAIQGFEIDFHQAVEEAAELTKPIGSRKAHPTTAQTILTYLSEKANGSSGQAA
jgi:hypothetical protein